MADHYLGRCLSLYKRIAGCLSQGFVSLVPRPSSTLTFGGPGMPNQNNV